VLVRDYLLDPSQSRAREIREELLRLKEATEETLRKIEPSFGREEREKVASLRLEIDAYWQTLDPVFDWSPEDKQAAAYGFLRRRIIPRRDAALSLAADLQTFTDTTFRQQREEIRRNEESFQSFLVKTIVATMILGLLIAVMSIFRVTVLERRSEHHRRRTEKAEREMRSLSHQLVNMQEEERRSISRELHDEVGQLLTGLRMELRTLQKIHRSAPEDFDARVEQTRVLLEQTLQSVRDIAMGLRPSMLDDLGLEAALQWQIREFERHHEIPVTLRVFTDLQHLPDRYRTNVYRIVQEALTNCARHAKAHSVEIVISVVDQSLRVVIRDDGVGMAGKSTAGLGLLGIQERVRELGGTLGIQSPRNKGTEITVELPQEEVLTYE
jgi:signal transduction histidine kinase